MHRTRHESLDFLGNGASDLPPHEDWAAFLSTSMTALATADDEPETESPGRRRHTAGAHASPFGKALAVDTVPSLLGETGVAGAGAGAGSAARKPRGGSMSESLTSSTGSSPSGVAWRPLGRRLTASHAQSQPPVASSASSSSASSAASMENQREHALEAAAATPPTFLRLASSPALSSDSRRSAAGRPLQHASSLRDVITSCLSSSGSSFYDSSSSSDDETPGHGRGGAAATPSRDHAGEIPTPGGPVRPGIIDVDPSYAESCLPVLSAIPSSQLPGEGGALSRSNSLAHVKSPVLSSRKDSATWQLQDEELVTSPRFGSLRGSNQLDSPPPPPPMSMFGRAGSAFAHDDASNQFEDNFRSGSSRASKDMRASSVDFTFSRPQFDVNPPLPPPQEPMQRLRARSFSYGSAAFQPPPSAYGKQYAPLPSQPPQMYPAMPQEFPSTLRGFHSAPRGPPPSAGGQHMPQHLSQGQPPPPPSGVRPPRVSIPADSPMHQYHQFGPPMLYRRYSTDAFVAPPYPDSFPSEREHHGRQAGGLSGRSMRSYSMEYGSFASRPMRSQSMEGQQLFAEEQPSAGYPPSLIRSNSAGVSFDWPRSRMDNAPSPPLPPDARPSTPSGHYATSPRPEAYYDVEFKRGRQEVFAGRAIYNPGEYVKVEADRGEDIGRIVQRTTDLSSIHGDVSDEVAARPKRHDLSTKKIIGVASQRECEMLNDQRKEEQDVFEVCKSKVRQRQLPMNVIDAEYQFDRHKLTFFFEADRRIDFRELVRDLFAIYKTRIWLQQVVPAGKKAGGEGDAN